MRLFIDCEWNDWQGELISMALVSEDGDEWYEVLSGLEGIPSGWVVANVMPVLNKASVSRVAFQHSLAMFLRQFNQQELTVVSDWPEDILHFCKVTTIAPGKTICPMPIKFEVAPRHYHSTIPHNALSDARALMEASR